MKAKKTANDKPIAKQIKNSLIDELKKICKKYGYKLTEITIEEINNE
jgi:hypothetical protein